MVHKLYAIAAGAVCLLAASAASATTCLDTDVSPNAVACEGFLSGNLLDGKPANLTTQQTELGLLGLDLTTSQIQADLVAPFKLAGLPSNTTALDFGMPLTGDVYFGIHYGNGTGGPGNSTAFYHLDLGSTVISSIQLVTYTNAVSDAVLYAGGGGPKVPEPATWTMMLVGFGGLGMAMRSRRKAAVA